MNDSNKYKPISVQIKVPHRISGFFQMMDPKTSGTIKNPLKIGSRGGGPALDAFVTTKLTLFALDNNNNLPYYEYHSVLNNKIEYTILINSEPKTNEAHTSITVLRNMEDLISSQNNHAYVLIEHNIDLPVGCGYGSSGAGAIGVALGLNNIFKLGLSINEAAKYAHSAEVQKHTGLGTVGGQIVGGLSISMEPGYPFNMDKIPYDEDIRVCIISFGSISTKDVLTNPEYKQLIYNMGKNAMDQLKKAFTLTNFLNVCETFLKNTNMLKRFDLPLIEKLLGELWAYREQNVPDNEPFGASLNQLGKSVFCICKKRHCDRIQNIMKKYTPYNILKCVKICPHGPIIKENNGF